MVAHLKGAAARTAALLPIKDLQGVMGVSVQCVSLAQDTRKATRCIYAQPHNASSYFDIQGTSDSSTLLLASPQNLLLTLCCSLQMT